MSEENRRDSREPPLCSRIAARWAAGGAQWEGRWRKPKDFKGTALRLLRYFLPQKWLLVVVLIAAILGTVFNIVGPKILGLATTKLFEGLIAK